MRATRIKKVKIRRMIILPVFVNMMNMFTRQQISFNNCFNYKAVFKNIISYCVRMFRFMNLNIPMIICSFIFNIRPITFTRTIFLTPINGSIFFFTKNTILLNTFTNTTTPIMVFFSNSGSIIERLQCEGRIRRKFQNYRQFFIDLVVKDSVDEIRVSSITDQKEVAEKMLNFIRTFGRIY